MPRFIHLGLGVLATTIAVAAAPSAADAATCVRDAKDPRTYRAQMVTNQIATQHVGGQIVVGEPGSAGTFCGPRSAMDKLIIRSADAPGFDRVFVDESFAKFNGLRIVATTGTGNDNITVVGSPANDVYQAHDGGFGASIDLNADNTPDVVQTVTGTITLAGNGGADTMGGTFNSATDRPTQRLELLGGPGEDALVNGRSGRDLLDGGADNDRVFAAQGKPGDRAIGGDGTGDFVSADAGDTVSGFEAGGIGGPKPGAIRAKRGETLKVRLAWSHPVSWKHLDRLTLAAFDGDDEVGRVAVTPSTRRVAGAGGLDVVGHGPVVRKGKGVSVMLEIRVADSLAGKKLDLRMQPKDR